MNGADLLAEFRRTGAESAFGELVRRYTALVFSVAKRRLGNEAMAQDVVQTVFIRLASISSLPQTEAELAAWLHCSAVRISVDLWRSETRRFAREECSVTTQSEPLNTTKWLELAPILDEALIGLSAPDRQAIVLRFFDGKSMRELGASLGVSEDAAKMRVSRAVERLRGQLSIRGVLCGSVALGVLLSNHGVEAAPSELVARLASLRFTTPTGLSLGLISYWLQFIRLHRTVIVAVVLGVAMVAVLVVDRPRRASTKPLMGLDDSVASNRNVNLDPQPPGAPADEIGAAQTENTPDPAALLIGVLQARNQIVSGELEMHMAVVKQAEPLPKTNRFRLFLEFDGDKRRSESVGREYDPTIHVNVTGKSAESIQRERDLMVETATKAGWFGGPTNREVNIRDGVRYLDYRENNGQSDGAEIRDIKGGSPENLFDPRTLGLWFTPSGNATVDECLPTNSIKEIKLIGKEFVDGVSCWHVCLPIKYSTPIDLWIDAARPVQVAKLKSGATEIYSIFDQSNPRNPLPSRVEIRVLRNDEFLITYRIAISATKLNSKIDSSRWTLAGLGMPLGMNVIDSRTKSQLGYWNGAGLSEKPLADSSIPVDLPNPARLVQALKDAPMSHSALEAALWIMKNSPDGPQVESAADVIIDHHIESAELRTLPTDLRRFRHASMQRVLEALVENNPDQQIRGNACFTLAVLQNEKADFGRDELAKVEAENLFERIMRDFGQVIWMGRGSNELAALAQPALDELHHFSIGNVAPDIEGEDLDGRRFKLSDYRGKAVVLLFTLNNVPTATERRELRDIAVSSTNRAIAIIEIKCDRQPGSVRASSEHLEANWRAIEDGAQSSISTAWKIHALPTNFLIDSNGVIRFRDVSGTELSGAINRLVTQRNTN